MTNPNAQVVAERLDEIEKLTYHAIRRYLPAATWNQTLYRETVEQVIERVLRFYDPTRSKLSTFVCMVAPREARRILDWQVNGRGVAGGGREVPDSMTTPLYAQQFGESEESERTDVPSDPTDEVAREAIEAGATVRQVLGGLDEFTQKVAALLADGASRAEARKAMRCSNATMLNTIRTLKRELAVAL